MTKRIVSGIFILTALGALGVILAGALTSGEQLIVRFLTAVIVAALGLYVISDLRLQADDETGPARNQAAARLGSVDAPPNSTAAFMATVTRRSEEVPSTETDPSHSDQTDQQLVGAGATSSSVAEQGSATVEGAESGASLDTTVDTAAPKPPRPRRTGDRVPAPATVRARFMGNGNGPIEEADADPAAANDKTRTDKANTDRANTDQALAAADTTRSDNDAADDSDVVDLRSDQADADAVDKAVNKTDDAFDAAVLDLHEATVDLDALELPDQHTLVSVGGPAPLASASSNGSHNGSTAVAPRNGSTPGDVGSTIIKTNGAPGTGPNPSGGNGHPGTGANDPSQSGSTSLPVDPVLDGPALDDGSGTMFDYSDDLQSPEYVWPAPTPGTNGGQGQDTSPFERASQAYQAEKQRLAEQAATLTGSDGAPAAEAVDPSSAVAPRGTDAADYALARPAEQTTPVIDLRAVDGQTPSSIDAAINVGEVEVVATLIEQGMLTTAGPITDRDVRTMVYVAFTSNELRKLLVAGGSPEGPNDGLELGPVELFDERIHTPAPKRLYSGAPQPNEA